MSKDEALKLALEALEKISKTEYHIETPPIESLEEKMRRIAYKAITAIKEALMSHSDGAHPEPWEKFCDSNCVWTDHHLDCKLAQQEPWPDEPVGHIAGGVHQPQRTWVNATTWWGLTDTEIKLQWSEFWETDCHAWSIEFAKAIEAKLKAKNSL